MRYPHSFCSIYSFIHYPHILQPIVVTCGSTCVLPSLPVQTQPSVAFQALLIHPLFYVSPYVRHFCFFFLEIKFTRHTTTHTHTQPCLVLYVLINFNLFHNLCLMCLLLLGVFVFNTLIL